MSRQIISTAIGKTVQSIAKIRGGGSALPGLMVEKIDPNFIKRTLAQLPLGVVVVSGTNGKTTTTKIIVELLASTGLKVFTNPTGSNFSRGIVASLINEVDTRGKLDADIAVLELDEAWAVRFVKLINPRFSLLLNVMRDQLDRFGEVDKVAEMLEKIALATTGTVVLNHDDLRINQISKKISVRTVFFGASDSVLPLFVSADSSPQTFASGESKTDVLLSKFSNQQANYLIDGKTYLARTKLSGVYNYLNIAAALCLVRQIVPEAKTDELISTLSQINPAFGRGEIIIIDDQPIELVLVKNPSGFHLAISSFATGDYQNMIAINDSYADGRDVSWLWDVDFTPLKSISVVSGARAHDMALRLGYDEITPDIVEPDLETALEKLLDDKANKAKRIYCTYTAMLTIRKILIKMKVN